MKQIVFSFGLLALLLLLLGQVTQYTLSIPGQKPTWAIALFGLGFVAIGFLFRNWWRGPTPPKSILPSRNQPPDIGVASGLSSRELEVLVLMAEGLSNQQIGNQLFIAETTVKTHVSNILQKLDASRRTEAISKARALQIIG